MGSGDASNSLTKGSRFGDFKIQGALDSERPHPGPNLACTVSHLCTPGSWNASVCLPGLLCPRLGLQHLTWGQEALSLSVDPLPWFSGQPRDNPPTKKNLLAAKWWGVGGSFPPQISPMGEQSSSATGKGFLSRGQRRASRKQLGEALVDSPLLLSKIQSCTPRVS